MTPRWQGHTDGTPFMQQCLVRAFAWLPLWAFYAAVLLAVPFYLLFGAGTRASYAFYRRRMGMHPLRAAVYCVRNHYRFGQIMIDRFARYADVDFHFEVENKKWFDELMARPEAFAMLSAHVGCYEMSGYYFRPQGKTIHALVYAHETPTVMAHRRRVFARHGVQMIPVSDDFSHLFALNAAISAGDIVSLPADRSAGAERTVAVPFFGAEAPFPLGPFAVLARYELPALAVFALKTSVRGYRLLVRRLPTPPAGLRRSEPNGWRGLLPKNSSAWCAAIPTSGSISSTSGLRHPVLPTQLPPPHEHTPSRPRSRDDRRGRTPAAATALPAHRSNAQLR